LKEIIDLIQVELDWLEDHDTSTNIVQISQHLNRLSTMSVTLGDQVILAYTLMNEMNDRYDFKYAEKYAMTKTAEKKISDPVADALVEMAVAQEKKDWTMAKNGHKQLAVFQDRVDRVMDTYKQYVSNLKDERYYSQQQV
jgi:hypothetical protein